MSLFSPASAIPLLLVSLVGICGAQKKGPKVTDISVPDQSVAMADGMIMFRDLHLWSCSEFGGPFPLYEVYLRGTAVNKTPHTWRSLWINMVGNLSSGGTSTITTMHFDEFRPEQAAPISTGKCGLSLIGLPRDLTNWEFKLSSFTYRTAFEVHLAKPVASDQLEFEDATLLAVFQLTEKGVGLAIKNKLDSVARIDWNQAAFVDTEGRSHQVTHTGIRYADARGQKAPTVIPPGARIEDLVVPADNISMGSRDWIVEDLLQSGPGASTYTGKTFSLLLPVDSGGKTSDYFFTFRIVKAVY